MPRLDMDMLSIPQPSDRPTDPYSVRAVVFTDSGDSFITLFREGGAGRITLSPKQARKVAETLQAFVSIFD